ncbi:MAG: LacI family DNA-binding transcriptional regulator [Planctomycetota bacterium]
MNTATSNRHHDPLAPLRGAYPSRGAADVLCERVANVLTAGGFEVGERFLTDDELAETTGLSRSTVRRAIAVLRAQGWLHSTAGRGTFVGRREGPTPSSDEGRSPASTSLRIGVLAYSVSSPEFDWFTPSVMRGIQPVAAETHARVELIGGLGHAIDDALAQLDRLAPDALICLSVNPSDELLLRHASQRGLRCLIAGTAFPELDVPRVCEDNRGGMDMVVRKVAEQGHRRIGLMMRRWPGAWLLKRHEQWHDTLRDLGFDHDEGLMHWLPNRDEAYVARSAHDAVEAWFDRAKPTAVICGHYGPTLHLGQLIRQRRLTTPADLSVAVIDQHADATKMLGVRPAMASLPLQEIGRTLARQAVDWCRGQTPPSLTRLPMTWTDGATLGPTAEVKP